MENRLFDLLNKAVSPFACVKAAKDELIECGFEEINYADKWKIKAGGKYVVDHHGTTLFAFAVGTKYRSGDMLRIAAAHTDYPCLRLKPNADFKTAAYPQVNVEVYGGPILNTWFDRPLGVAGRVALRSDDPFHPRMVLYRSKKPVMIVPNLAIHMNRDVNKGVEINNQIDLMPVLDCIPQTGENTDRSDYFITFLAKELGVDKKDIIDFELNTFCMEEPSYVGIDDTMISAPRLDNQTSCYALLSAIENADRKDGINVIALFDHEEIGSSSKQGAASILMHDMLRRILRDMGECEADIDRIIYEAMLLSVDVAHAIHPNVPEKNDPTNKLLLNHGFGIKTSAAERYASDPVVIGIIKSLCEKYNIRYQRFVNRSDIPGGSTLGAIAVANLPIRMLDIGVPVLAMHSSRETMGIDDQLYLERILEEFFAALQNDGNNLK